MRWLILVTLLTACGSHHDSQPVSLDTLAALRAARDVRLANTPTGWPSTTDCDGLLWASLAKAAGVVVDLSEAESSPGVLHRRPIAIGECYPEESASTISNDMLWGYVLGADKAALARVAGYGETHSWVMGQPLGEALRVVAKPNLIIALGKRTGRPYGHVPCVLTPPIADFERHLQLLAGLACGQHPDITGANGEDDDALAEAVAGHTDAAAILLLDTSYTSPTYVRGSPAYANIHWLFAAAVVLREVPRGQ